jgi:TPR repeat protein
LERNEQYRLDGLDNICMNHCILDIQDCSEQINACNEIASIQLKQNNFVKWLEYKIINCEREVLESCHDIGNEFQEKTNLTDAKKYYQLACRNGLGGYLASCGELGYLIKKESPKKAKEYLKYACNIGLQKYCK